MRYTTSYGMVLLLVGGLLVVLTQSLSPVPAPLYDGLTLPPEHYRYLQVPAGQGPTKPPTSASQQVPVAQVRFSDFTMATGERPPQAALVIRQDSLQIPPGVAQVTLAIQPVLPPTEPKDATIDGNVYRFVIRAPKGASLPLKQGGQANVFLRGTVASGSLLLEQYKGGQWVPRPTTYMGSSAHVYRAAVTTLGYFALVVSRKTFVRKPQETTNNSLSRFLLIAFLIIVLMIMGFLLFRLSRQQPRE